MRRWIARLMTLFCQTGIYHWWLNLARPVVPNGKIRDPFPGQPGLGQAVLEGRFHRDGESLDCGPVAPWRIVLEQDEADRDAWLESLYAFDWLRDLAAHDEDRARQAARRLIDAFIEDHGLFDGLAWRQDILARRLLVWLSHAAFVQTGSDDAFRDRFHCALARQVRHLNWSRRLMPGGLRAFDLGLAWLAQGLGLGARRKWIGFGMMVIAREAKKQISGDGGHESRNPVMHVDLLEKLVACRDMALAADQPVAQSILSSIDRLAPMIRFFRHGDGKLALFHGGNESKTARIEDVLARSGADGRPVLNARHAGYQRLEAGDTVVLADYGRPPADRHGNQPHAGTLAFEMTSGKYRVITQCGTSLGGSPAWRQGLRSTPAHSTLCLGDSDSSALGTGNRLGRRIAEVRDFERHEENGATWIRAAHTGWQSEHGLLHARHLFLDANGGDLRGEDLIMADSASGPKAGAMSALSGADGMPVSIRFHLHPNVDVLQMEDGNAWLLRLPSGPGWQLRGDDGHLSLEDSIYCGRPGERRPAKQLVLTSHLQGSDLRLAWSLLRHR